jgi:hypothetical protein
MQMQAEDLRIYALAYALWHDDTYLQAAHFVAGVLLTRPPRCISLFRAFGAVDLLMK